MSKSMQQIQQELTATEDAARELGKELETAYQDYLDLLSQTAKKQLLLGGYYICTQIYPESFLNLNFDRREKVQQKLRQIGRVTKLLFYRYISEIFKLAETQNLPLNTSLKPIIVPDLPQNSVQENLAERSIESDSISKDNIEKKEVDDRDNLNLDLNSTKNRSSNDNSNNPSNSKNSRVNSLVSIAFLLEAESNSSEALANLSQSFQEKFALSNNPEDLLKYHKQIEQGIGKSLELLNLEVNRKLQQAGILPQKIPSQLLEIPMHSIEAGNPVSNMPYLLELTIEMGNGQESENKVITKIVLLRLKVSELEFNDFALGKKREGIRNIIAELSQLRQVYNKLKKEYLIVRAEAAWRSSWYEG